MKVCPDCGESKSFSEFNDRVLRSGKKTTYTYCKDCAREREKQRRLKNNEQIKYKHKLMRDKLEINTMAMYSQGGIIKCACCGERRQEFLTMDHINNDGADHRRKIGKTRQDLFRWLKSNNYPPGFQVLCFNCNCAKEYSGYCPHQIETKVLEESYALPLYAGLM